MAAISRGAVSRLFSSKSPLAQGKYDLLERAYGRLHSKRCLHLSSPSAKNADNAELEQNPFYAKYAEKIKLAKEISEDSNFSSEIRPCEERLKVDQLTQETKRIKDIASQHQNKQTKSGSSSQFSKTSLDSILHMDLIVDLESHQIEQSETYDRIKSRSLEFPRFLFPLPRDNGYEFMFSEFKSDICLMTSLLQYQTSGEHAPWVLAIRHFTELQASKEKPERLELLKQFNKYPEQFDHMSLINQLDQEIASGTIRS